MIKLFATKFFRPVLKWYLSKEHTYCYEGICLRILPGVFHPAFFFSTKFLLTYIGQFNLKGKKVLEPGAGSGLISFVAEKQGALVTASDLSVTVIKNLHFNKHELHSAITIIQSDLFDNIADRQFDFIIINPPYYAKNPLTESQLAWYCGGHFEFFEKLFSQLHRFTHPVCRIIMVLSEDCDTLSIEKIAAGNGFTMKEVLRKKFLWEWNFIFEITEINQQELL